MSCLADMVKQYYHVRLTGITSLFEHVDMIVEVLSCHTTLASVSVQIGHACYR
jgi:hypothetical protein